MSPKHHAIQISPSQRRNKSQMVDVLSEVVAGRSIAFAPRQGRRPRRHCRRKWRQPAFTHRWSTSSPRSSQGEVLLSSRDEVGDHVDTADANGANQHLRTDGQRLSPRSSQGEVLLSRRDEVGDHVDTAGANGANQHLRTDGRRPLRGRRREKYCFRAATRSETTSTLPTQMAPTSIYAQMVNVLSEVVAGRSVAFEAATRSETTSTLPAQMAPTNIYAQMVDVLSEVVAGRSIAFAPRRGRRPRRHCRRKWRQPAFTHRWSTSSPRSSRGEVLRFAPRRGRRPRRHCQRKWRRRLFMSFVVWRQFSYSLNWRHQSNRAIDRVLIGGILPGACSKNLLPVDDFRPEPDLGDPMRWST